MTHFEKYHRINVFDDGCSKSSIFTVFRLSVFRKTGVLHQYHTRLVLRVHKLIHWSINSQNASFYGRFFQKIHCQNFLKTLQTVFENLCAVLFVSLYCSFFNESIRIHASVGRPNITRPRPVLVLIIWDSYRPQVVLVAPSLRPRPVLSLKFFSSSSRRPRTRTIPGRLVSSYWPLPWTSEGNWWKDNHPSISSVYSA